MRQWIKDHNPPFPMHVMLATGIFNAVWAATGSTMPELGWFTAGGVFAAFLLMYQDWRTLQKHNRIVNKLFETIERGLEKRQANMDKRFEMRVASEVGRRLREINGEYTVSNDDDRHQN